MDQLHRPDLRCATDRARREGGHQQVPDIPFWIEQALHLTDDVHDVGVALNHHQLADADAARNADAAQVVATEVHEHHVLGPLLRIGQEVLLQGQVFGFVAAAGPGARDRPQGSLDPAAAIGHGLGLDHHLGTRANQVPASEVEEGHVRRGVDHPQAPVELKRLPLDRRLEALADDQLEDIPSGDVFLGREHGRFKFIAAAVAGGGEIHRRVIPPIQGGHPSGQGLMHALLQRVQASDRGVVGGGGIGLILEIDVGHRRELALDLIEGQEAVGEHPAAVRRPVWIRRVNRNAGLNPADQLVAPETKQLPQGGQPGHRGGVVGRQGVPQQIKGIATEGAAAPITPALLRGLTAHAQGPERIADHKTPAANSLAAFHRLEQNAMVTVGTDLQPGGQGRLEIRRPGAPDRDVVAARLGLGQNSRAIRGGHHYDDGRAKKTGPSPRLYRG